MGEHERPQPPRRPDLSSDAALDRLLRRLGPLLRWQEHEDRGGPEEERTRPDLAFEHRLRAQLLEEEAPMSARRGRRPARGHAALRVGLAAATVAVMILVAVAVVEVGVVTAITAALALIVVAAVLVVRARLGQ